MTQIAQTLSFRIGTGLAVLLALMVIAPRVHAQTSELETITSDRKSPLAAMQGFISKADGARCPMHPSCSAYSAQAFKRHGVFVGWILTSDRLLRCGRDETRRTPIIRTQDGPRAYDPLSANTFWWKKP